MLKIYYKSNKDTEPTIVDEFKVGSWIRAVSPNESEIQRLVGDFELDEGLVRDALDEFEVPRMEKDGDIVYVYTRVPLMEHDRLNTVPVLIAVAPEFIATVSAKEFPFIQEFIKGKKQYSTTQKAKLLVQIFSEINDDYQGYITKISKKIRGLTNRLESISNKDLVEFVRFEEILNDFLAALSATNIVLNNLLSGRTIEFYEDDKDLIEDMFLSNAQLIESSRGNLKNIVNIREAYSTIMSQDLNRIIKVLTILTIVLNVPVLVASIYGMNVTLPGADSPMAFWWILWTTAAVSILLLILFFRSRWLR